MDKKVLQIAVCGALAGAINGLFGAGGGMVLVPALSTWSGLNEKDVFPCSVSIILPICLVSLVATLPQTDFPLNAAIPFWIGSIPGGLAAGFLESKIKVVWMHRILGIIILWGGIRYLW